MFVHTKTCKITIHLKSGTRVSGKFHTPKEAKSSVRPSDAIRDVGNGFILLTEAAIEAIPKDRQVPTLMIPAGAILMIEIPRTGWRTAAR